MLKWILKIIVIAIALGSGTGLSSDVQQRDVAVDPKAENKIEPSTLPEAESLTAEKVAEDMLKRDSQKADSAPGNMKKAEDPSGIPAEPSSGRREKGGSKNSTPHSAPDEAGAEKKESEPSGGFVHLFGSNRCR